MNVRCMQAGIWLERRHSGLRDAEGLQLEDHLAQCLPCRKQAEQLDGLRSLILGAPCTLSPRTRQRVLRNALAKVQTAPQTGRPAGWTARSLGFGVAAAFGAAAAAAVAVWPSPAPEKPHAERRAAEHQAAPAAAPITPQPQAASEENAPTLAAPEAAAPETQAAPEPAQPRTARGATASGAPPRQHDAGLLLRRARAELARGAVPAAEASIRAALQARPTRSERAEAASLKAECALVAGRPKDAQAQYLDVARRFAGSDAGDNALFAAARLAQQLGDAVQSQRLLRQYLTHYPKGRFRPEAERRLQRLTQP